MVTEGRPLGRGNSTVKGPEAGVSSVSTETGQTPGWLSTAGLGPRWGAGTGGLPARMLWPDSCLRTILRLPKIRPAGRSGELEAQRTARRAWYCGESGWARGQLEHRWDRGTRSQERVKDEP